MKLPLFLLFCTIGYSATAQDSDVYRKLKSKADSLSKTDNLLHAEATYLKALNIFSHDPILKRNLASIYLRMGKVNNADKFILSAIENGATMHVLRSDLSIDNYFKMYPQKNEAYSARVRQRKLITNMEDKKSWMDDHRRTFTNNNYYH